LARGRDSAPFPPGDVRTAEELVRRAGLAIENARLFESEQKARRDAEHAADRVTRLQTITASLVERLTPEQIATIVVDQAIGALGAERGAMGLLVEGGSVFEVVRAGGYPEAEMIQSELRRWERFPVSRGGTWAEVARTGEAVFTVSGADRVARHPEIAGAQEALGLNATATLPLAAGGRIKGVLWLGFPGAHAFDGSEREFLLALARHCSQALERASLDLAEREALELRNEFLSVAAHELKTPMTALRGSVQLLLRLREKQGFIEENRLLARLALIDEQTGKMSRLVDQLLDISRIEAGRLTLERAPTDLAAIVRGVAANAQARSEQHAITVWADGPLLVSGDALRLEQVIANLVDNAIKYSPGGGPIELAVTGCAPDQACVTVTDHGIGIAPEHRGHIFDRFFQAHSGQHFGGMGLGLYISHQIVDLHGGSLEVEFPESGGTRFVARLPAKLLEEESKIPP
ncbi:MAG TPA: ATP-binding protein, partial [Chloroflexota bacterium]|nr:ATP-binding protein [Chloroflexota bacterium]